MTPSRTLARDYKHVRRNAPGTQGFTGWTGLLIGLSIGLAVALGVFLHYRNPAPEQPTPEATAAPASAQASETAPPAPAPAGAPPEYDFYKMLPEQEVEVPKDARAPVNPVAPAGVRGDVTLQVGSFKGMDQAEKMQARLALQGIESRIQRFTLQDETWYRVRIGPIGTVEELDAVRAKLAEAEVEATPVSSQVVETPPP
ncbi:MAG TPA: SPOR domain-containing protein [Steroidobacteraceae bacterium]|jgi:cell division protein FtsN|nr:SPOR domain-containing protein [Steroidobacteraceae bacterium]